MNLTSNFFVLCANMKVIYIIIEMVGGFGVNIHEGKGYLV